MAQEYGNIRGLLLWYRKLQYLYHTGSDCLRPEGRGDAGGWEHSGRGGAWSALYSKFRKRTMHQGACRD